MFCACITTSQKVGTRRKILKPLFLKAIANAIKFMLKSVLQCKLDKEKKDEAVRRRLYFHLEYHDQNPLLRKFKTPFLERFLTQLGKAIQRISKCTWRQDTSRCNDYCKPQSKEAWRLILHYVCRNIEKKQPPQSRPTFDRLGWVPFFATIHYSQYFFIYSLAYFCYGLRRSKHFQQVCNNTLQGRVNICATSPARIQRE